MNNYTIEPINVKLLHFDYKNPRLSEFNLNANTPEEEILKILWETMSVEEIVLSIASSGFFNHEPLIAVKERKNKQNVLIVIEGNRRLGAVKSILDPDFLDRYDISHKRIAVSAKIKRELNELPVIIVDSREEAWKYIGFKHINGPVKWGSYAKAQYISQIHKDFGIPLNDIAVQIGDTHKTVQKLYQGLMVIDQAERRKVFDRTDITGSRLYFSHLYTALTYEGIRSYLGIKDVSEETVDPVPSKKVDELGQFLIWLFGSKSQKENPVIKSQNPDLRHLDQILRDRAATLALKDGVPLITAYEISQPTTDIFEQCLVAARQELQKAHSFVTIAYDGNEIEPLKLAGQIANLADALYKAMEEKHQQKNKKTSKSRIS